ncbi:hypothetical protein B0J18DRAFT_462652 [Chaetomium sp. MPI-SDFR-AT-0129]|nr:hypothetical protein B0J18DRAFT_462652 [Chaetomium sp. MPI-SDFR-AT-0129]
MTLASLISALGAPIEDPEEETFELFAQDLPSQNLGFIDSRIATLELTVGGRDLAIHQSPGVLSSNRAGGTTGAVVWKITPLFADWLSSPSTNPLFTHALLTPSSYLIELGSGTSGLVALLAAPQVSRYVLTDQAYVAKLVEQNVAENWRAASASPTQPSGFASGPASSGKAGRSGRSVKSPRGTPIQTPRRGSPAGKGGKRDIGTGGWAGTGDKVRFMTLDWETDEVTSALTGGGGAGSFDAVVACDCIYNEALVEPFVSTCVDVCQLRAAERSQSRDRGRSEKEEEPEPCVCVVAQQLRAPDVFEAWVKRFAESFHTWRVPDELLVPQLRSNSGFVVHLGVLKSEYDPAAI